MNLLSEIHSSKLETHRDLNAADWWNQPHLIPDNITLLRLFRHFLCYLSCIVLLCCITYISYRVTGLYRLGKTCYLHSLVCNNSIICIVYCAIIVLLLSLLCKMILFQFDHGKMITQPTLTPPQTRDW